MRKASSSSSSVGSTTGMIALIKALVMLEDLPVTLVGEGN
jgi:hypothetical protein